MEIFLKQVAWHLLQNHKNELFDYWLVYPNKRSGLFMKQYLKELSAEPVFVPPSYSIDEFIAQLTNSAEEDQLGALIELFKAHKEVSGSMDTFDDFYFWGEMLLNDFDDIDKYLVDAKQLYTNLLNIKEIDQLFMDFDEDQKIHINSFWEELYQSKKNGTKKFTETWENLYPVYKRFRDNLSAKNLTTKGMMYRKAASELTDEILEKLPFKKVGFVGFNALTKAEEKLFSMLQKSGKARFFWDYSEEMVMKDNTSAGHFLKKYTKLFPGVFKTPIRQDNSIKINVSAIPSASAQVNVAGTVLNQLPTPPGLNTAVVMADETLLHAMMHGVPASVQHMNITMGYPLKSSQVSALINQIIALQQRIRLQKGKQLFHYKMVLQLFSNSIIQRVSPLANAKQTSITNNNLFYVDSSFFNDDPVLRYIFKPVDNGVDVPAYFTAIFEAVLTAMNSTDEQATTEETSLPDTEKELTYAAYSMLVRAKELLKPSEDILPGRDLVFRLIKRLIDGITVPFEGEPLKGLQLMGILETRNMEFENLIVLSANEGFLPSTSHGNSFIPYNLRKGFGLPTVEEQDAMYAYYFYRLLYRAKNVHLLYDSSAQGVNTGEPSRYISQLSYLSDFNIIEQSLTYDVSFSKLREISIPKTSGVTQLLQPYKSNQKKLSATSLNTYLDCSLKFYFAYVEGIKEPTEVQDDMDARIFGNVFHDIMEKLYKPFEGKMVSKEDLLRLNNNKPLIEQNVKDSFARNFFNVKTGNKPDISLIKGKLLIYVNVLLKYTHRLIAYDTTNAPFYYIEGERDVEHDVKLNDGTSVRCVAKIDRVDEVNSHIRITDYKSGDIKTNSKNEVIFKGFDGVFYREKSVEADQKAIFQTLFYSWIYHHDNPHNSNILPVIIPIRSLFGDAAFKAEIKTLDKKVLVYNEVHTEFEEKLTKTIESIFDKNIPFNQTTDIKTCDYCDFKNICGR